MAASFPQGEASPPLPPSDAAILDSYDRLSRDVHLLKHPRLFPTATATAISDLDDLREISSPAFFKLLEEKEQQAGVKAWIKTKKEEVTS